MDTPVVQRRGGGGEGRGGGGFTEAWGEVGVYTWCSCEHHLQIGADKQCGRLWKADFIAHQRSLWGLEGGWTSANVGF